MEVYRTSSAQETESLGDVLANDFCQGDFVALFGEMGSGKTVFVRGFCRALVPDARVSSPTFSVLNVYQSEERTINHFDMYRITSEDDLLSTGYEDVIQSGITLCEWPENIEDFLPKRYCKIVFRKNGENERILEVEWIERALY